MAKRRASSIQLVTQPANPRRQIPSCHLVGVPTLCGRQLEYSGVGCYNPPGTRHPPVSRRMRENATKQAIREDDMKGLLKTVGLAALAAGLIGTAQAAEIKIGVVLPYSGVNADLGNQIDKAF